MSQRKSSVVWNPTVRSNVIYIYARSLAECKVRVKGKIPFTEKAELLHKAQFSVVDMSQAKDFTNNKVAENFLYRFRDEIKDTQDRIANNASGTQETSPPKAVSKKKVAASKKSERVIVSKAKELLSEIKAEERRLLAEDTPNQELVSVDQNLPESRHTVERRHDPRKPSDPVIYRRPETIESLMEAVFIKAIKSSQEQMLTSFERRLDAKLSELNCKIAAVHHELDTKLASFMIILGGKLQTLDKSVDLVRKDLLSIWTDSPEKVEETVDAAKILLDASAATKGEKPKARIIIYGLSAKQTPIIAAKWSNDFRLVMPLTVNKLKAALSTPLVDNDHVISLTSYIAHSAEEHIKNAVPSSRYTRINGSMSALGTLLFSLARA